MVGLGDPEGVELLNPHPQFALRPPQLPGRCGPAGEGLLALGRAGREDHRPVGIAAITELTAAIEGIDVAPVGAQQGGIAEPLGIKAHPHTLLVTGAAGGDLAIGGSRQAAAAVATLHTDHPGQGFQVVLQTPETAPRQHGLLTGGGSWRRREQPQHQHKGQQRCRPQRVPQHPPDSRSDPGVHSVPLPASPHDASGAAAAPTSWSRIAEAARSVTPGSPSSRINRP